MFSGYSHIIINITAYCIVARFFTFNRPGILALIFWLILGAIFADIDHERSTIGKYLIFPFFVVFSGRRSEPHTLVFALLFALPVYLYNSTIGYIFFGSYIGHLLMDTTTKMRVPWLYPLEPLEMGFSLKWDVEYIVVGLCVLLLFPLGMWQYLFI